MWKWPPKWHFLMHKREQYGLRHRDKQIIVIWIFLHEGASENIFSELKNFCWSHRPIETYSLNAFKNLINWCANVNAIFASAWCFRTFYCCLKFLITHFLTSIRFNLLKRGIKKHFIFKSFRLRFHQSSANLIRGEKILLWQCCHILQLKILPSIENSS